MSIWWNECMPVGLGDHAYAGRTTWYTLTRNSTCGFGNKSALFDYRNCWRTDRRRARRGSARRRGAGWRRSAFIRGGSRRQRAIADRDRARGRPHQSTRIASYRWALATHVWRRGTGVFRRSGRTVIHRVQFARVGGRHVSCGRNRRGQHNA